MISVHCRVWIIAQDAVKMWKNWQSVEAGS